MKPPGRRILEDMRLRRAIPSGVLAASVLLALVPIAGAAPRTVEADRSDNSHRFEYDAEAGGFGTETSGRVIDASDPVTFTVFVRRNKASDEVGQRLKAKVSLVLNAERRTIYDGTFTLRVVDEEGAVAYKAVIDDRIVLRPLKGHDRKTLSFVFDLPSGTYEAFARFKSTC